MAKIANTVAVSYWTGKTRDFPINTIVVSNEEETFFTTHVSEKKCGACRGDHSQLVCTQMQCHLCNQIGHHVTICPNAKRYVFPHYKDAVEFFTEKTENIVWVTMNYDGSWCSWYHLVHCPELDAIEPSDFVKMCAEQKCKKCGADCNTMVCKCATAERCKRCQKIHQKWFCNNRV
jgi:hypothetical protein